MCPPSVSDDPPDGALTLPKDPPLRSLRILVVDGDPSARTNIAAVLRGDGHDVHLASDGVRAVALHAKHPFDAVIADLLMARMTGRELARAIKRLKPSTPVILVTAHPQELTDSPYDLIIRKPLQPSALRAALARCCP